MFTALTPIEEEADLVVVVSGAATTLELGITLAVVLVVPDEVVVPLVPPVLPGTTALLTLQAPFRVGMTVIFWRAAGVEPQFVACVIHSTSLSRSNTTVIRVSNAY